MKVLISERQKMLVVEQGIFGRIIKSAKDLENIKFVNLELPKIKITKLIGDINNFNSKQLKFLSDIEKNVDVASNFKKYSSYKVELDNIFKNFYFDFFKDVDLDLDLKLIYKKINDGDNSWVKLIDNSEAEDFLLKYYMLLQQRKDYFRILLDKIKIKYVEGKNIFIENTDKENWEQLIGLRKSNVIDDKQFFFFMKNPKEWFSKKVEFGITPTKSELDLTTDGSIGDVTDVVLDNLKGKEGINTEYMFFSDDVKSFFDGSDKFPKTTTPKDVEVVVSRLKNKDIDYKTLDKHIEELGVKQWGGNSVENQIWREFKVGGVDVKFKFGTVGTLDVKPKFWEWDWASDLKKDWGNSKSDLPFEEYASYWFKKYQKDGFLNTKDYKWDDYFQPFNVSAGVREIKYLPDGSKKSYITVNPNTYQSFKSKNDFYEDLLWVIDHEIGHVDQPAITINRINQLKYYPNIRNGNTDEVISHLNQKIDGNKVLRYDIDLNELGEKVTNILINDFNKEFPHLKNVNKIKSGKIINSDFFEYCANRLTDANMGSQIKEIRNKITVFKNWEKANAYRYFFKETKWGKTPTIKQDVSDVLKLSDSDLIKYIENNATADKNIKKILYDSAYNLSYLSNKVEIEADFSGLISNILRTGGDKSNKGFTTWMVDYLKSPNKKELLKGESGPLRLFKKLKGEYPNPIKQKEFNRFKEFLTRLENQHKAIYPKENKKLYQDIYKQLYELISKGYPALLPFVFADGLDTFELSDDEKKINESVKNFNKLIITESQYKLLKEFKKKAYSFDWDDNILIMPTRIHLDYNVNSNDIADLGSEGNKIWVPVSVSTEQFRSVRHKLGKEFRYPNDDILSAFKDFRDYDAFIEDTKRALSYRSYGPSFNKFIEALISGSDFSIITARSNPPQAIKEGIKLIIRDMSWGEQKEMEKNLNGLTIDEYLNLQDYHPVSSEEFAQKFGLDSVGTNPEEGKKIAFKSFVDRIVSQISKIKDDKDFEGISVGFSDDDEGNVEVIEDLIRDELKRLHPEITFTVYDTSDPKDTKKKRIIIKK